MGRKEGVELLHRPSSRIDRCLGEEHGGMKRKRGCWPWAEGWAVPCRRLCSSM
jgi:hypothetical protein